MINKIFGFAVLVDRECKILKVVYFMNRNEAYNFDRSDMLLIVHEGDLDSMDPGDVIKWAEATLTVWSARMVKIEGECKKGISKLISR